MVIAVTNGWGRNSGDVVMTFWGREFSDFFWIKCDDEACWLGAVTKFFYMCMPIPSFRSSGWCISGFFERVHEFGGMLYVGRCFSCVERFSS